MTHHLADADFITRLNSLLTERRELFSSFPDRDPRKAPGLQSIEKIKQSIPLLESEFERSLTTLLGDEAVRIHEKVVNTINPKGKFSNVDPKEVAKLFQDMHQQLHKVNDGFESREREIFVSGEAYQGERKRLNEQRVDELRTVIKQHAGRDSLDDTTIDQYVRLQMVLRRAESYGANLVGQAIPTGNNVQDGAVAKANIADAKRIAYALQGVISADYGTSFGRVADFAKQLTADVNQCIGKGAGIAS